MKNRIVGRGTDAPDVIERRLGCAKAELALAAVNYDYIVLNATVDAAVAQVEAIIEAEQCNVKRNLSLIRKVSGE